jgi:hypothetical protein
MKEPDIKRVEQRLEAVLDKARREAITYTVLTVLCTPAFVAIASVVAWLLLAHIFMWGHWDGGASSMYMGINIFLAYMVVFVLRYSNPPEQPHEFDKRWLVAVGVFLFLLILTYATGFREQFPVFFGIVYAVMGFLVLGLLGHVQMNRPVTEDFEREHFFVSLLLAVSNFIVMSYGEITHGSWLWIPPKPDEVRVCAWILCKLAVEESWPLDSGTERRRLLGILARLKLVEVTEHRLKLTVKGLDFVTMDIQD